MTCAFAMMRPITNSQLPLSQRIMGRNRAPLWHFLTPERRNSAIGMHGDQRQSSQPATGIQNKPHFSSYKPTLRTHRSAKGDSSTHERCPNPHDRTSLHPTALTRTPNARENKKPALSNRLQILDGGMYETRTRDLRRDRPAL